MRIRILARTGLLATALVAMLSASSGMAATPKVLETVDPILILQIAKSFGAAGIEKDAGGDPMISGQMQGVRYEAYFYGCTQHRDCRSLQISAGFTNEISVEKANDWNVKYRWVKAHKKDGTLFRLDLDLDGGVTRDNIAAQFATFDSLVPDMKDFLR